MINGIVYHVCKKNLPWPLGDPTILLVTPVLRQTRTSSFALEGKLFVRLGLCSGFLCCEFPELFTNRGVRCTQQVILVTRDKQTSPRRRLTNGHTGIPEDQKIKQRRNGGQGLSLQRDWAFPGRLLVTLNGNYLVYTGVWDQFDCPAPRTHVVARAKSPVT